MNPTIENLLTSFGIFNAGDAVWYAGQAAHVVAVSQNFIDRHMRPQFLATVPIRLDVHISDSSESTIICPWIKVVTTVN